MAVFIILQLVGVGTLLTQMKLSSYFVQELQLLAASRLAMLSFSPFLQDLESATLAGSFHQVDATLFHKGFSKTHLFSLFPGFSFQSTPVISEHIHEPRINAPFCRPLRGNLRLVIGL